MTILLILLGCSEKEQSDDLIGDTDRGDGSICETYSVDECPNDCNLISGFPAVDDGDGGTCIDWTEEPQPAACSSYVSDLAVISFAEDENGTCWAFSSGTYPFDWTECEDIDECTQVE